MALKRFSILFIFLFLPFFSVFAQQTATGSEANVYNLSIEVGAERLDQYLGLLEGKKVGIVGNQSSIVGNSHLVDTLLALGVDVKRVYSPEHGFRGNADAGEEVKDGKDPKTGVDIISIYGKHKKPTPADLEVIDILIFDIQDVGVRFFTYISTLHYVMEAAAENDKAVIVLDRPNPNGFYVDGPILEEEHTSFIGMHPGVPVVHGMTVGEYAQMMNGEGWFENKVKCELTVIPCANYKHDDRYKLPIRPSPNLPNMSSIYLYPSLCFFEGTKVSVGRGTPMPFQIFGYPGCPDKAFSFIPVSTPGASKNPKHKDKECQGVNLQLYGDAIMPKEKQINLSWLLEMYASYPKKEEFFRKDGFFYLLAGNKTLKSQIVKGLTEQQIRESWETGLNAFKEIRKKYLLYVDYTP